MFENYIGQEHIKKVLTGFINYSNRINKPLQHMLITGPSGTGKTLLANEIAKETKSFCKTLLASTVTEEELVKTLWSLHDRDILILDEIQSLKKNLVEILFPVMSDRLLYLNYNGTVQKYQVSNFTIIGATDRAGQLNSALLNRFKLTLELVPYTEEDLVKLAKLSYKSVELPDEICYNIVSLCKGVPRILLNILSNLEMYMESISRTVVSNEDIDVLKTFLNIDKNGLDNVDRQIIEYLYKNINGASVDTLASVCGCLRVNIEQLHEPYLIKLGLINKCSSGRSLTATGRKYYEESKKC